MNMLATFQGMTNVLTWLLSGGVVVLYVSLLKYKSRSARELEERLEQLRQERGNVYTAVRPLR